jgi:hypothetical protein
MMRRATLSCVAGVLLAVGALPARAVDGGDERVFVCDSGNCQNGRGTARSVVSKVSYTGNWRNGKSVPGETYELTHPLGKGVVYHATYAANGLQDSGDMLFGNIFTGRNLPVYVGSFAHVDNAFAKMQVPVPKRGRLDMGQGVVYTGRFEYLPSKSTMNSGVVQGVYIFFGTMTDAEDETSETGLFVTDVQMHSAPPAFFKANANYLMRLQKRYQEELSQAKVEFAERESSDRWRSALAVVGRFAFAFAGGGNVSSALRGAANDAAMNLVSGMLKGDDAKISIEDATNQAIQSATAGDEGTAKQLQEVISR